jgi:hypothetical protein
MIKSRRMRWAGHVARIGERRNSYRILVGEPEGKRLQYMCKFFQNSTGLLIYKNTQWMYRIFFSLEVRV